MLKIINAPNPILSQPAKRISKIDKNILELIADMKESLESAIDPVGVGLAAPQVGRNLQIFIIKQSEKSQILVFINTAVEEFIFSPIKEKQEIQQSEQTAKAKEKAHIDKNVQLEGCLSLPNIWGEVKRNPSLKLSYLDEKGDSHSKIFKGFMATIIQHECDHLNGILFPKRVLAQKGKLYKSQKNEKGEDVFEEIEI